MELALPLDAVGEPPTFRSRFGGLWTDRSDAHQILENRSARGALTDSESAAIAHYIDYGYVIYPRASDEALIDEYVDFFERSFDECPPMIAAHCEGKVRPISRDLYDRVAKVNGLHSYFTRAGELIYPPPVLRFLMEIYDRPPVAFQTMSMRKGSEEPLHIDTGPLTLTEPMTMVASWLALEDVKPMSGEFEFVPGSHRLPELLHHGVSKGHNGEMGVYGQVLARTQHMCDERGLKTERFMAKKGDVLIWHADLMHGGAKIEDPERTRKSLVVHFMPLGVMPTFYDFSCVSALPYTNGGYCLDNLLTGKPKSQTVSNKAAASPFGVRFQLSQMKRRIPLPARAFVRTQVDRFTNPQTASRTRSSARK
jgi:phytanoyl-CoA hydroxylase